MKIDTYSPFTAARAAMQARFQRATIAPSNTPLLEVDYDREEIFRVYLSGFDDPAERQSHCCNCCRSFLRQAGGIVTISPGGTTTADSINTLWSPGDDIPEAYRGAFAKLHEYISSLKIKGPWTCSTNIVGVASNFNEKLGITHDHFSLRVSGRYVANARTPRLNGEIRNGCEVMRRGLEEISIENTDTVLEIIAQGSLYRGTEHKTNLTVWRSLQDGWERLKRLNPSELDLDRAAWRMAMNTSAAVTRIRNTSIGTLLVDLASGRDLESSLSAYERIVAPINYRRPKAVATVAMIERAKSDLIEAGYAGALRRRKLDSRDLTAAHALFVHRPKKASGDVFDALAEDVASIGKINKVEEVTIDKFVSDIVPHAKSMRVFLEREHFGNMVALTGPAEDDSKPLFAWENSFGWSYTGGVADSIKEQVRKAGGRVDNVWMRCSLAWSSFDDLDLHLEALEIDGMDIRRSHGKLVVYYGARTSQTLDAKLDVDMNVAPTTETPVENIYVQKQLPAGRYRFRVHCYTRRNSSALKDGYTVEIEVGGTTFYFGDKRSPSDGQFGQHVEFRVTEDGSVIFREDASQSGAHGLSKWGLKSGHWHRLKALTVSPNHWNGATGNKHWFFLLDGCVADERVRPFYNEFLHPDLRPHRKVTELLADKIVVDDAEGQELSGLGFSDTQRRSLCVEVEGKFKSVVKVKF